MAKREVTVVINGEEYVSKATGEADAAMSGFAGKIPGWAKAVTALAAAYAVVSAAVSAVKDYVLESFAAYDKFAASQTKLAAQSKLTGVSLSELNKIAEVGRESFNLSAVTANEAATTVAKYASRAGDATQANKLLAAALDLGAASGLTAAESMDALEQGLRGQDEGFDKLLGKNPSSLWKDYADANGLAVGKMSDTQKRMAELTAVVEAGNMVQGSYNERLDAGSGKQEALNNKIDEAKAAFGQALQPLRIFVVQGLTTLVEVGGRVALAVARVANAIGVIFTGAVELGRSVVGGFAVALGKLTGNKELEEWGKVQANAFGDFQKQLAKLEEKYLTTGKAAEESAANQKKAGDSVKDTVTKTAETVEHQAERMNRAIDAKLGKPMAVAIGLTEGAITRLGEAAISQLPTDQSQKFLTHMQGLVTASGAARDKIMGIGEHTEKGAVKSKDMAREVETLARGALDAAVSFGVIDDSAARSLTSAINIASAIGNMAKSGFSFAGVVGVISGVASIVNSMMAGDAERRRLLNKNNVQLERLEREVGNLSANVSGNDFLKAEGALERLQSNLAAASPFQQAKVLSDFFKKDLGRAGLTEADLDRIAGELGITIRNSGGQISVGALGQLLQAIRASEPGQFGGDFLSQLDATTQGFGVRGTDDVGQINDLARLGGRFSSALNGIVDTNDLAGTRARLAALFERLNSGGVSAQELGGLTGSQFLDLITNLIGRIDNLGSGSGSAGGGTISVPDGTGTGGGTVSAPTETIQSVIGTMNTNLGTILTTHTTLHERIAAATEGSYQRLTSIDEKMDTLISVTSGNVERTDAALEQSRRLTQLERGILPVLR